MLRFVTLSGFLNFIDGLWSSCGDERIIIFTTNRKEKLDPALIPLLQKLVFATVKSVANP
ncbi:putative P-loop containing nucleoside triphosphate hydrolase [Helianthus annuus]|nr:putative P-loop containing nucleoside triphosphate hydrolase [Helianthus annuus]